MRFKYIDVQSGNWNLVEVPKVPLSNIVYSSGDAILAPPRGIVAYNHALQWRGMPYDWVSIMVGFSIWPGAHDPNRLFCSEACVKLGQTVGLWSTVCPWRTAPGALFELVSK